MSESPSFARLLSGVREGDTDAVGEIIARRFTSRLIALAACNISQRLRRREEAEDVVQSVFRTLFRRLDAGLIELRDWEYLWGLLARIAARRVRRLAVRNAAAKRSQDREVELTPDIQSFDREPRAEEVLIAEEEHDRFLAAMPEHYRAIVEQILEGRAHGEIARALGTSIATVERVHRLARERLAAMLAEES